MKILAIDFGEKRIGLAVAIDDEAPRPFATVETLDDISQISSEIGPFDVIIVGLPRNIDSEDTLQTNSAREFAKLVEATIETNVVLQDEFDTSNIAAENLKASGKPFSKSQIDAAAAVLILNDYLESRIE